MAEEQSNSLMQTLFTVTRLLGETFGTNCEVVVHDLTHPETSIVAIANGHVTGRKIGSPITNAGLKAFCAFDRKCDEMINYQGTTPDGRHLKCSSAVFRDTDGTPIAALCINFDITPITLTQSFLDDFCGCKQQSDKEEFYPSMDQAFDQYLHRAITSINKPVIAMTKEDKICVVSLLNSWGVFLVKNSTEKVAEALGVTRFTIYNYLDEIKNGVAI